MVTPDDLKRAVEAALHGDWEQAHLIAQESDAPIACWIHAVLHKMEPDPGNSRYWYARSGGRHYEDYADPNLELLAIAEQL
jgi:hypothetical protein